MKRCIMGYMKFPPFWAPKVSRKCQSKHWYACGADGVRSHDYQIFWDGSIYLPIPERQSSAKMRWYLRENPLEMMLLSS